MRRKIVLSVVFLVMAILFLTYTSAHCEQDKNTVKLRVALIVAKPSNDLIKNRIGKGYPVEAEGAEIPIQDNALNHFNRGVAHDNSGMYKEAIEAYKSAIRIKPDYPEAHYNLALSYLMLNDSNSAHKEYLLLKNIDPQIADNLYSKTLSMVLSNPDNKYVIQVGAFRNIQYANEMVDKLKANYPHAQIETGGGFSKVRVLGMKNKEEADVMMKDISDKFKIDPFLVPAR